MPTLIISSGRGPIECERAVQGIYHAMQKEALSQSLDCKTTDCYPTKYANCFTSIKVEITGPTADVFASSWIGTIQYIWQSNYRKTRRKNWFVGVSLLKEANPVEEKLNEKDLKYDFFRSSGPGGQNVNKVASAVRVTHLPTGLTAESQEERSQHQNRRISRIRLLDLLKKQNEELQRQNKEDQWDTHNILVRGNPIRTYSGPEFTRIG